MTIKEAGMTLIKFGCIKLTIDKMKSFYKLYDFNVEDDANLNFDFCNLGNHKLNTITVADFTEGYIDDKQCAGIYYVPISTIGLSYPIYCSNQDMCTAILLFIKTKDGINVSDTWECLPYQVDENYMIDFLRKLNLR